jgi:hypothetical protein
VANHRSKTALERIVLSASFLAAVTAFIAFLGYSFIPELKKIDMQRETLRAADAELESEKTKTKLAALQKELARVTANLTSSITAPESETAFQVKTIAAKVDSIEKRLFNLEQAILAAPDKALAVPILRRDLDTQKERADEQFETLRLEIQQSADFNKWFLGLMATMTLTLFGFIVSHAMKRDSSSGKNATSPRTPAK